MSRVRLRTKPPASREGKSPVTGASIWHVAHSRNLQIVTLKPFGRFPWLVHGFSTRVGGVSVLENPRIQLERSEKTLNLGFTEGDSREHVEANRRRFKEAVGANGLSLVTLRQIHSDIVHRADSLFTEPPKGDALISHAHGLLLAIQIADCIPILLVDPRLRIIAAIHAGWRGTLARIAAKTVGRMQMEFGVDPEDLLAALGPGIHPCCYEVGPEVAKEFSAQFSQARDWFEGPFDMVSSGEDPNPLPWLSMMPPGHEPPPPRCHLDLYAANRAILEEAGVKAKNIFSADLCTACRTDLFFSYRREGRTGRMMAAIGMI